MSYSKEELLALIHDNVDDHLRVDFWFDTLYARHEKSPEFTQAEIYAMLTNKPLPEKNER